MIELGGNIELVGFKEVIDGATMIVLKKIVGNYVRKFSEISKTFEKLTLTLKEVHTSQDEKSRKFELHARVLNGGKPITSEVTDKNLFFAVDSALKKVEKMLS